MAPAGTEQQIDLLVKNLGDVQTSIQKLIHGVQHQQQVLSDLGERMLQHEYAADYRIRAVEEWKKGIEPFNAQVNVLSTKIEVITTNIDMIRLSLQEIKTKNDEQDKMYVMITELRGTVDVLGSELKQLINTTSETTTVLKKEIRKHEVLIDQHTAFQNRVKTIKKVIIVIATSITGLIAFANGLKELFFKFLSWLGI
jgi:hypothetical protein